MTERLFERLLEAKEKKHELERAERRYEQLRQRLREQERLIPGLEVQLDAEQADVDKLNRLSWSNVWHTLLRSKEEQLELERQQALAAGLKLQEVQDECARLKEAIAQAVDQINAIQYAEQDYSRLLAEKEQLLRAQPEASAELEKMESQIAEQTAHVRELSEALTAGKRVLASLEPAIESFESAIKWGNWDTWGGGGMISSINKHNYIDDAKRSIETAKSLMQTFKDELADVKQTIDIEVNIGSWMKIGDIWFDDFFSDMRVQKRVKEAQQQALDAAHEVRMTVQKIEGQHQAAQAKLQLMKNERTMWLEQQKTE
ncbi:hypothetical protein [Paenibacillus protaetiae]|uniref:Uncharacterized protein n=1 Tax=Paenibacillus protaetiae TaxID=2509456 RepID=A0A4P6F911_9BACL|nr:hypothetical protein [Paenibacillus protaetiae]QAY66948.1 hypothetical protein ET464_11625 [Paenibacillus protaetiae]